MDGSSREAGRSPRSWRGAGTLVAAAIVVALAATASLVYLAIRAHQNQSALPRTNGIPASVSTSLANMMQLSTVPVASAPNFTLTDQDGRTMSLASLRGSAVVLEFMDPHCTDICPIVSQEVITAYRDLGKLSRHVVFIAVNVNRYHLGVSDVAAYSREQQLTSIPSWHFLTGAYPSLRRVWQAYFEEVYAPGPNADVVHSSVMYFIDAQGRERFVASPMVDHTSKGSSYLPAGQLTSWGHGIALVARTLGS